MYSRFTTLYIECTHSFHTQNIPELTASALVHYLLGNTEGGHKHIQFELLSINTLPVILASQIAFMLTFPWGPGVAHFVEAEGSGLDPR
jgi:hypothetical protein